MDVIWNTLIMMAVGGLIGWITNVIAIKMLFWPKKPITIPGTSWQIIGLLPKRHHELAVSIGQAIDENLLPLADVIAYMEKHNYREHVVSAITTHVDTRIRAKLPQFIPEKIKSMICDYVKEIIANESEALFNQVIASSMDQLQQNLRFGPIVEEKIKSFDLDHLERLIKDLSARELRHIELIGLFLGIIIGLFQALLLR